MTPERDAATALASSEPTPAAQRSIGDVHAELVEEFPGLKQSKLRFLEQKGLVTPHRTSSGYRMFSSSDVDRLRLILVLQRDHHLPLASIRDHLRALDAGEPAVVGIKPRLVTSSEGTAVVRPTRTRLRRREFLALTGASDLFLAELEAFDVVAPSPSGFYGDPDLDVVRLAVALNVYGIEPRHIRSMKGAAERQAALVDQVTTPRRRTNSDEDEQVSDTHQSLLGLCASLHSTFLGVSTTDT